MSTQPIATEKVAAFLQTTPLFMSVEPELIAAIAQQLEYRFYANGEIVLHKGEPGDGLYLVMRGRLQVISHRQDGTVVCLRNVEVGESVGELALLTGERSTTTVYAVGEAELAWIALYQFDLLAQRYLGAMRQISQVMVQHLQQTQLDLALHMGELFDQLDEPALRALRAELELVVLHGGEVVIRQGEPSDALYVVLNGLVRVVLEQGDGRWSKLYDLRRGQTVGEIGILTGKPRTATVYAVRDSLLARLSRTGFERLLAMFPQAMLRQFAVPVINVLRDQANHGRLPERAITTIAVVPINSSVAETNIAAHLSSALARYGPTLHLSSANLEQSLAKHEIAQIPPDAPASIAIVHWLNEQETSYRYIVYEADPIASHWSARCIRQADCVLLVGDADAASDLSAIERTLLTDQMLRSVPCKLALLHSPDTVRPSGTQRWLEARHVSNHYHVRRDNQDDLARMARLLIGRGIGMVLSGGGAAGFGHVGAIRALREAGIPIDRIGGTSMGGLIACQYAMGWDDDTIMAKNRAAIRHKFDYTFPFVALMNGGEMTNLVQEMFDDAQLEDMWIDCFCITANLSRATMMIHDRGPVWKYTRATTSIPGVLPPLIDNGELLLDGGLINNLPTDVMYQRGGCEVVFACDTASLIEILNEDPPPYESNISGWKLLWRKLNPFATPVNVPTIGQIMARVAVINDVQNMPMARDLADFYIRLDLRTYGMLEFKALEQIVADGYRSAQTTITSWREDSRFQALQGQI